MCLKSYVSILLCLIFWGGPVHAQSQSQIMNTDQALTYLAKQMVPPEGKKLTIAVLPPRMPGKGLSQLSLDVADGLGGELAKLERCKQTDGKSRNCQPVFKGLLERRRLSDVVQQQFMELNAMFDPGSKAPVDEKLGVTGLVLVSMVDSGHMVEISAKLVEVATGSILALAKTNVLKDERVRMRLSKKLFAKLTVTAKHVPPGAKVRVAGREKELSKGGVVFHDVPQGQHELMIEAPCMDNYTLPFYLNRDRVFAVYLEPKKARLELIVNPPDARVSVDGLATLVTMDRFGVGSLDLPAGEHTITAMQPGYPPLMRSVNLECGRNHTLNLDLIRRELPDSPKAKQTTKVQKKTIQVDVRQRWVDTGITVKAGDEITLKAQGKACYSLIACVGPWGEGKRASSRFLLPGGPRQGLIARIGNNSFSVGDHFSGKASKDGTLYLGMNELNCQTCWLDNRGAWIVRVWVR